MLLASITSLLVSASSPGEPGLTLSEAMSQAWSGNARIRSSQAEVDRTRHEEQAAWGHLLPEVNLVARTTRIDKPVVLDLDPIRSAILQLETGDAVTDQNLLSYLQTGSGLTTAQQQAVTQAAYAKLDSALPHFLDTVQGLWTTTASLQAVWPIFTGGRLWAARRASTFARRSQEIQLEQAKAEVGLQTVDRYLAARLATEAFWLRESSLAVIERHAQQAAELREAGQISRAEQLKADVALAEARRDRDDAERAARLARMALANALGREDEIFPADSLAPVPSAPDLETLLDRARANHPGLRRIRIEEKRARQGTLASAGEALPTVALFGSRELLTQDLSVLQPHWAVGVTLQWNLFRGGQDVAKTLAARETERSVEMREVQARRDVELLVRKQHRELQDALDRSTSLVATRELAEENLRAQRAAFAEGLAGSLDVVDAELTLARVRLAELSARRDAALALAGLREATGDLTDRPLETTP